MGAGMGGGEVLERRADAAATAAMYKKLSEIRAKVREMSKAGDNPKYRELMEGRGTTMLNLGGAEAEAFIRKWQSTTAWLYHSVGAAKKDPATLGIPKP